MGPLHRNSGSGGDERPHLDDDAVVEALRRTVPHAPPADVREQHLAAIAEAAAAAGHEVPDTVPTGWVQRWGSRARRVVALTAVKVGLSGATVALAAGGGLAATGNLPDPAQRVVADVAERVGVDLPRPAADRPARSQDVDGAPERSVTPRVEQPGPADDRDRTPASDRVEDQQRPDRPAEPASRRPAEGDVEGEDMREDPPASDVAPVEPGAPDHAEDDAASSQGDDRDPGEERRERQGDSGEQQAPDEGSTSSSSGPATGRANDPGTSSAPDLDEGGDASSAHADTGDEPDPVNP